MKFIKWILLYFKKPRVETKVKEQPIENKIYKCPEHYHVFTNWEEDRSLKFGNDIESDPILYTRICIICNKIEWFRKRVEKSVITISDRIYRK